MGYLCLYRCKYAMLGHNKMEIITGIKPSDMLNAEESVPL